MDRFFGLDQARRQEDLVLLTTAHDDIELTILCDILTTEGIPFVKLDRGSGSSVRILLGYSMYGTDILVLPEHLDAARELLEAYRNGEEVADDETDGEPDEEDAE